MKNLDWDLLRQFLAVAAAGGLSGAAPDLGVSVPTLGRRMQALEQATGMRLFWRGASGYRLTDEGRALQVRARAMAQAAAPLADLIGPSGARPVLRVSAGTATMSFLCDRFDRLSAPDDPFTLALMASEERLDIARGEIDLGLRNRPAEGGNLASLRLGDLGFAPYRSRSAAPGDGWVALLPEAARHPAALWLNARPGLRITAQAGRVSVLHDLVRAGVGQGVMPCLLGDRDPQLMRAGPLIPELAETQHLVMHDDRRHLPAIRCLIARLRALYADEADLIAGHRPLRAQNATLD